MHLCPKIFTLILITQLQADKTLYSLEHVTLDLVSLLDVLKINQAIFIGHDWGGAIVWSIAMHYPHRVAAVAAVCTPKFRHPPSPPTSLLQYVPSLSYQVYFQNEHIPEMELEKDIKLVLRLSLLQFIPFY